MGELVRKDKSVPAVNRFPASSWMEEFQRDFEKVVSNVFGDALGTNEIGRVWGNAKFPRFNIIMSDCHDHLETADDGKMIIEATVPGYKKEDIEINVDGSHITIKGSSVAKQSEDSEYLYREIHQSAFTRSVAVNTEAWDLDQIEAKLEDGILTLTIPRKSQVPIVSSRKIDIG